jgi:nucleotide-binding universal stress UspA family protein
MIKNILFGSDGSPCSAVAAEYAFDLADRLDARLEAVCVVDSRSLELGTVSHPGSGIAWMPTGAGDQLWKSLSDQGRAILAGLAREGEKRGIPLATSLEFGIPSQVFEQVEARTELVILGRQGEHASAAGGPLSGSTMDRYVRRASRCCMVTPGTFTRIQKILVAVDGTVCASHALRVAAELANALRAPLVILSVADREADLPDAARTAENAHSLVRAHDCAAAALTAAGDPALRIQETAEANRCDLIVLGAHGRSWLQDHLLGAVATRVLAHATTPVLLVR